MKLRFTPRAIRNIADVADFLEARNPAAANRVQSEIYETLQNLLIFPRAGRSQSTEGVRKIVTKRYSYLIYYTVDDSMDEIVILNIKHPAQRREHAGL